MQTQDLPSNSSEPLEIEPPASELARVLDNTAVSTFMECEKKYDYSMRQHRRRRGQTRPALAYGSVWHHIMETHYRTGGDATLVEQTALDRWEPHGQPDDHRTVERAIAEYYNYVDHWGSVEQDQGKTLGFPEDPLLEISVNISWDGAAYPYAGKIDRIFTLNGHIYVEDHKTTAQMGAQYFRQFELSPQMMGYVWIARQLIKMPIAGVRINAHAVYKTQSKFEREIISFSDARLVDWAQNYNIQVSRIKHAHETNTFVRNFGACAGKYGMCQYADVCSVRPDLRHRVLEADFDIFPWNPLETDLDTEE